MSAEDEKPLNPWQPTTDPHEVAVLGKLQEELNECGAAAARCLIQGINETEPVTGKPNKEWLEDEIADVLATVEMTFQTYDLDADRIAKRTLNKLERFGRWHEMIDERKAA